MPDEDWTIEWLYEGNPDTDKDFSMTHNPCSANYSGGADTNANAKRMIENNKTNHVCSPPDDGE